MRWRSSSTLPSLVLQSLLILLLFLWSFDCGALRCGYIQDIMNEAPTGAGSIPLQEYRREIPPGWQPNDPQYPLRSYFDRLRLWYRIANLPDEAIGPTIAGRLYGRAHRVAMSLRAPRPDGGHDTGDAALVRLEVDEVRDPNTGVIIQHHVPSGVQHLTAALRMAFGQQDQDLATQSLDKFFGLARGRLSLQEYSVEFDARFDEASDRAGLQMNEVARFFLFFKNSGLSTKQVDDIKLQVAGDFTRFAEARALALRLSSNKQDNENMDNYYAQDYFQDYDEEDFHGEWMDEESYNPDEYDHAWWADYGDYYDEGEWVLDYDDGADAYYQQFWNDDEHWSQGEEAHGHSSNDQINNDKASDKTSEQPAEEYYGGKGQSNDGCFVCGSKWHRAKDCPMSNNKGSGKGSIFGKSYGKGKGKPGFSGKGKGKFWRWRPFRKGKGKGKGHFGRGKYGGGKGYGKRHWFAQPSTVRRGLDIKDGIPDGSTRRISTASASAQEYVIHTPPSDHDNVKFVRTTTANTDSGEDQTIPQSEKKHLNAFSFAFNYNYYETAEYFAVRGEKRRGLIIDPGAASGLIGCDTLKDLIEHCIKPYGKEISIDKSITSPVSGISGGSDRTLGQVTIPLVTGGCPISFTGEVIGGDGSMCPALVGNPSLRKMNSTIFTNYFQNGDGLLVLDSRSDDKGGSLKMLRILLTDSGHYILPTDYEATAKVSQETQQEVAVFWNKVAAESCQRWTDVNPKRLHIFHTSSNAASYAEGDRGEAFTDDQGALCHDDQQLSEQPQGVQLSPEVSHDAPKDDDGIQNQDVKITGKDDNDDDAEAGNLPSEPSADDKFHNNGAPTVKFEDTKDRESHVNSILHNDTLSTVCTDEKPCGFTQDTKDEDIPHFHTEEDFPAYKEDMFPDGQDVTRLRKKYKAMPEEYYTRTGLKPVTPKNFSKWFMHAKGKKLRWHFWEVFSGSGRLSLTMLLAGLTVGFPIDMRYGWDVGNPCHQKYLRQARDEFCPGVIHLAPECGPWSVSSSSKDPDQRQAERLQQKPSLDWTEETCHVQSKHGRGYAVEQPWGSALWQPDTPLDLTINEDNKKRQRVDQCMHGAECEGYPVQKATGLGANFKLPKTALRCSGHKGTPHAHLQGQGGDGLNRTAKAAVYPRTLCHRLRQDIVNFLYKRKLLHIRAWPQALNSYVAEHFYECVRCQLGRYCPDDIAHTMIPGKCRHGRYAPGTNPRDRKSTAAPADPIKQWKDNANRDVLEIVELKNLSGIDLSVHNSHYLKKFLMEVIQTSLGIISEAANRKIDYELWVDNAVFMALFKEIFADFMLVKGVRISLRPFRKSGPEPNLAKASAYLRLHLCGHVKEWTIQPLEDIREMSISQINENFDVDDWLVTVFGAEQGGQPAPSTPSHRPRAIPPHPALPARRDDAAELLPEVRDRPGHPEEEADTAEPGYEEEAFESHDRAPLAPIRPSYNLKKVFDKLPKLLEAGQRTQALRLLVGMHERLWHTPVMDFQNLLKKANMPQDVIDLAAEAVKGCSVCRKFVRLPNRPQLRAGGSSTFGETLQMDLFHWEGHVFLLIIDEATRFKVCPELKGQDSETILAAVFSSWMAYFGPPKRIVLDQQMSLMGWDTAHEFERLSIERCPRGTTQGPAAVQHTGTGIVERHISLMKITMSKLQAELQRQGLNPEPSELAQESAMAHNQTINYGGVTPCMNVFGVLPRGFYNPESPGVTSVIGALQTDLTVFERAMRIRQSALAQTAQAIIEDRTARANRTRPHQLKVDELTAGTSEVEFFRDQVWRGPALLLRLDQTEGVAVIQYQGKPYLVSLRHIREHRGIFHFEIQSENVEQALFSIMKYTESISDYRILYFGWLKRHKDGKWYKLPKETPEVRKIMEWAELVSKSMTKLTLHGIMIGKALKSIKPPHSTTGTMIMWLAGGRKYSVQHHTNSNNLKLKKISNLAQEDTCMIYFYYYKTASMEPSSSEVTETKKEKTSSIATSPIIDMDLDPPDRKRETPETRAVVIAPEKKRQKVALVRNDLHYLQDFYMDHTKNMLILLDYPDIWKTGCSLMTQEIKNYLVKKHDQERQALPILFNISYKTSHQALACLRTSHIYKVDQETNNINEDDLTPEMWPDVDKADLAEIRQFVEESAFRKIHKSQFTSDMVIVDAIWVRKKKRYPDGSIRIKSRLCARGFLDSQKSMLTTRSTTATRLSQRLLVSHAAQDEERDVESLDVGGAFLKGFSFKEIQQVLEKQGHQAPSRTVIILPPLNVFKHLANISDNFKIPEASIFEYGLLCDKPIYGLNDAPLAWQFCLHDFIKQLGGHASRMDENTFMWKENGLLTAMATTHVDDIALTAIPGWLDNIHDHFVKRFNKITRQKLPFVHCGCYYERLPGGYRVSQTDFSKKLEKVKIPEKGDNEKLTPAETSSLRSILGALLWVTATRLDVVADVSILQSRVTVAEVRDLKYANQVVDKVKEYQDVGLHYRFLKAKNLRLVCIHDASSASQGRHYAQEGFLICLTEDKFYGENLNYETIFNDGDGPDGVDCHGGVMHVLHASGTKAKRVSYSTSHAETLSMINGVESSTLIMVRLSELLHPEPAPSLLQLTKIQEEGNKLLPVDYYGDCRDVFELVTGERTLPQDKSQRLYVLSIKEARLMGKIRLLTLIPTQCMTADSLTKSMIHASMLLLLTTGIIRFFNVDKHHVTSRIMPSVKDYSEHDLLKGDTQIMKEIKEKPDIASTSFATVLAGFAIRDKMTALCLLAMTSTMPAAAAMDSNYNDLTKKATEDEYTPGMYYFFMLLFFAALLALIMEKFLRYVLDYVMTQLRVRFRRHWKVKEEPGEASPMDVDAMTEDDYEAELRSLRKKIRKLDEDKEELMVTIQVKQDCIKNLEHELKSKEMETRSGQEFRDRQQQFQNALEIEKDKAVRERETALDDVDKLTMDLAWLLRGTYGLIRNLKP
eukprot:s59_g76.t1